MKTLPLLAASALALLARPAVAQDAPDAARLKATVEKLVSFGTRHTSSGSSQNGKRGIGPARDWAAAEFAKIGNACGGCITVERVADRFAGPRAPDGVVVENVLGVQRGSGDSSHVVIIAGHIDSRVSDPLDAVKDAPGANDNASGSALVLEAARLLSREKFSATIVYALLSGEEQGLWGGQLMARTARERRWRVAAMLNNDIVGGTKGLDGRVVSDRVRIFSEGIRFSESQTEAMVRRGAGGEDDGPSRALAKAVKRAALAQPGIGLEAFLVRRPDRTGRGGDHTPFLEHGFPAVRFSVGVEDYDHQHQDLRTENGRVYGDTVDEMDFPYLAKVTALNVSVLRELAKAPPAPASANLGGAVSSDTKVSWAAVDGAAGYRIRWRRNDRQDWEESQDLPATATSTELKGLIVDDHFVGVSALSKDGAESLVTFAGSAPRP